MEKINKIFEQGEYSVVTSKDGANALIVQLVKTGIRRVRAADGTEGTSPVQQVLDTATVSLDNKNGHVRPYDELDKELDTKISDYIRKAKSMATKEALGTNLLSKVNQKYGKSK